MKVNFLLADEVRPEMGGKNTVLGLYADGTIVLENGEPPKGDIPEGLPEGVERLAFLINTSELPEGVHHFKGQITDPSGNPHGPEISFGESTIEEGASRTIVVEAKPFLLQGIGTYHFNFYVDDVLVPLPFKVVKRT